MTRTIAGPALVLAGAAVAALTTAATQGQSRYCDYRPGTLAGTIDEARGLSFAPGTVSVPRPIRQHRVALVYTDAFRPTSRWSFELIAAYSLEANIGRIYDYYLREVRLEEDARSYWLLLRDDQRRVLHDSARAGDTITAFVDLAGAKVPPARSRDTTMWALVLREFDGPGRRWFATRCPASR